MTLRVAVAGTGTIGGRVAVELDAGRVAGCELAAVLDSSSDQGALEYALSEADVLVEASTGAAARSILSSALDHGVTVVLCSCGILADPEVERAARDRGARVGVDIRVPAGAIGGLDILGAAARAPGDVTVRHTTTKTPEALNAEVRSGPVVVFRGTAREAALEYPATSNSSVALALATTGLDAVEVVLIADPRVTATRHHLELTSPLGHYDFTIDNTVSRHSGGRTSEITAWSVIHVLEELRRVAELPGQGGER